MNAPSVIGIMGLPGRDASDLEWLLGEGGATFERSTTGAILEQALLNSDGWKPCAICTGRGILTNRAAVRRHVEARRPTEPRVRYELKRVRGALEDTRIDEHVPVDVGSWCQFCRGTGAVPERRPAGSSLRSVYRDGQCVIVGGLDARPGSVSIKCGRSEPNASALVRFARVTRRLGLIGESDRTVLLAYHGDPGARWGREPVGRIFVLYPLTRGGRSLLGKGRGVEGGGGIGGAAERLWSTVAAHLSQPRHRTHAALMAADSEAREMLSRAVSAWVATEARAFVERLERRYPREPPPKPAFDQLLDVVESWAGAPTRGTDGVWR